jgi:hypothetical protein
MARPVEWFQRLPQILTRLEAPSCPAVLNRKLIEQLFGVERRNAQYLLIRFGAARLGNALVIDRQHLVGALREFSTQDNFERQVRRHEHVRTVLSERRADLQLARISLRESPARGKGELPASIQLAPGRLSIEFAGVVDLLSQLLELSQAIGADFERFEGMLNQDPLSW